MSFLTRTLPRKLTRTTALNARLFTTTSPFAEKTAADTAKETVDSVNKKVGDAAVKGIEKGRTFYTFFVSPWYHHIHTTHSQICCFPTLLITYPTTSS